MVARVVGSVRGMAGTGLYATRVEARPDPDLMDLVPVYLERRHADVVALEDALKLGDMERVRILGHSMKGSGGGYGFDGITEIGLRLEDAGRSGDAGAARTGIEDLEDYLRNVEVLDG
jgi:HPt (histidine-containing phosphotransfer) domain-containing protein